MYSTRPDRRWRGVALLAITLAVGVHRAPAAGPIEPPAELVSALATGVPESREGLRLLQQQVRRVVAAARPVTVAVEMDDSVGSGVIISADGLVLTAGHVFAEPNREVWVRFPDNSRVRGRSLGVNHELDSGLVRITETPPSAEGADGESDEASEEAPPAGWPYVPLAERALEPGEWVVGLGQPNGFVEGRAPPVRLGRVLFTDGDTINTDVTLVGGDSGGPLLNLRGEVVGIHSKIGRLITENFHVPATAYRREWDRLLAGRMRGAPEGQDPRDYRPMVGVAMRRAEDGVLVTQVFPGEPAEEAGLVPGDVLVAVAGEPVASPADVGRLVREREPFERVPLTVRRGGEPVEVTVWLGRAAVDFPGSQYAQEAP